MLHRRPDLVYPLHHKANGLPYAAFVDDKLVRERGLVSHFDLLPYSDEKAMKMLSTQWKYHDPAGTYWTTVEECYTLMAVASFSHRVTSGASAPECGVAGGWRWLPCGPPCLDLGPEVG